MSDPPNSSLLNPQVCVEIWSLSHIKECKESFWIRNYVDFLYCGLQPRRVRTIQGQKSHQSFWSKVLAGCFPWTCQFAGTWLQMSPITNNTWLDGPVLFWLKFWESRDVGATEQWGQSSFGGTNSLLKHIPAKQWIPGRVAGLTNGCQESSPRRLRDEGLKVSLGWSGQTGKCTLCRGNESYLRCWLTTIMNIGNFSGEGWGRRFGMVQNSGSTLEWLQDWDSGISDGLGCKTN